MSWLPRRCCSGSFDKVTLRRKLVLDAYPQWLDHFISVPLDLELGALTALEQLELWHYASHGHRLTRREHDIPGAGHRGSRSAPSACFLRGNRCGLTTGCRQVNAMRNGHVQSHVTMQQNGRATGLGQMVKRRPCMRRKRILGIFPMILPAACVICGEGACAGGQQRSLVVPASLRVVSLFATSVQLEQPSIPVTGCG